MPIIVAPIIPTPVVVPTALGDAAWDYLPQYIPDADDGTVRALLDSLAAPSSAWSTMLTDADTTADPYSTPFDRVAWLAAMAGIDISTVASDARKRAVIGDAAWRYRGTVQAIRTRVAETLTGAKNVEIVTNYGGDPDAISVTTFASQTPTDDRDRAAIRAEIPGVDGSHHRHRRGRPVVARTWPPTTPIRHHDRDRRRTARSPRRSDGLHHVHRPRHRGAGLVRTERHPRGHRQSRHRAGGRSIVRRLTGAAIAALTAPQSPPGWSSQHDDEPTCRSATEPTSPTSTPPPCLRWGSPTPRCRRRRHHVRCDRDGRLGKVTGLAGHRHQRRDSRTADPLDSAGSSLAFGLASTCQRIMFGTSRSPTGSWAMIVTATPRLVSHRGMHRSGRARDVGTGSDLLIPASSSVTRSPSPSPALPPPPPPIGATVARNMYGATSADFTITSGGRVIPGAVLTLWTARTGGTQITDLLDVDSVACGGHVRGRRVGRLLRAEQRQDRALGRLGQGRGWRYGPTDITGDPPVMSIGTVGTGTAAASLTGTSEAPVLNLTLPSAGANGVNTAAIQNDAVTADEDRR